MPGSNAGFQKPRGCRVLLWVRALRCQRGVVLSVRVPALPQTLPVPTVLVPVTQRVRLVELKWLQTFLHRV